MSRVLGTNMQTASMMLVEPHQIYAGRYAANLGEFLYSNYTIRFQFSKVEIDTGWEHYDLPYINLLKKHLHRFGKSPRLVNYKLHFNMKVKDYFQTLVQNQLWHRSAQLRIALMLNMDATPQLYCYAEMEKFSWDYDKL